MHKLVGLRYWNPERIEYFDNRIPISRKPNNFGDMLSPLIVNSILRSRGMREIDLQQFNPTHHLLAIGSILHFAQNGDVVWGSGINGKIPLSSLVATDLDIRMVRGPLTRQVLVKKGIYCPEEYGDPALLFNTLFPSFKNEHIQKIDSDFLVIPNLNDIKNGYFPKNVIHPCSPIEWIIMKVLSTELVVASSLHGIILAESLGIPARAFASSNEPEFKYLDYYEGTNRANVVIARDWIHALQLGGEPLPSVEPERLLSSFPFDIFL